VEDVASIIINQLQTQSIGNTNYKSVVKRLVNVFENLSQSPIDNMCNNRELNLLFILYVLSTYFNVASFQLMCDNFDFSDIYDRISRLDEVSSIYKNHDIPLGDTVSEQGTMMFLDGDIYFSISLCHSNTRYYILEFSQ